MAWWDKAGKYWRFISFCVSPCRSQYLNFQRLKNCFDPCCHLFNSRDNFCLLGGSCASGIATTTEQILAQLRLCQFDVRQTWKFRALFIYVGKFCLILRCRLETAGPDIWSFASAKICLYCSGDWGKKNNCHAIKQHFYESEQSTGEPGNVLRKRKITNPTKHKTIKILKANSNCEYEIENVSGRILKRKIKTAPGGLAETLEIDSFVF